jgi:hypothetical protein
MKNKYSQILKLLALGLITLESIVLAFFMRPIQDDYFNLQSVQQMGVTGYLIDTWDYHGGNMVQFLIHCIVILPTTQSFVYWNLGLFFLATELLVFFSVRAILSWLFASRSTNIRFWVPLLSVAGFEGIFVPGFLGAYGFSLATLAHLWPVMAFIFGLIGLKSFRGSWILAFLLGLIAGNSNLGESAFACGAWVLVYLAFYKVQNFESRSGIQKNLNFYLLGFGSIVGTIGIAAAPGFWNRASDQVGLPESLMDFAARFTRSFASFSADALSHPMVWVLLTLGAVMAIKSPVIKTSIDSFKLRLLAIGSFLIWFALIMGSTFAYPAWHQSMGMYVLLLPLAFGLGVMNPVRFKWKTLVSALTVASLIMIAVLLRAGVMGINRSLVWDRNLQENICLLKEDPEASLLGAEIQYPPFKLGVEDVNTWEWMRDKYVGWVNAVPNDIKCD